MHALAHTHTRANKRPQIGTQKRARQNAATRRFPTANAPYDLMTERIIFVSSCLVTPRQNSEIPANILPCDCLSGVDIRACTRQQSHSHMQAGRCVMVFLVFDVALHQCSRFWEGNKGNSIVPKMMLMQSIGKKRLLLSLLIFYCNNNNRRYGTNRFRL